ncbi:MAG TPA: alpha-glucuronidase family glycosyl hydrolase, partial [Sphingomicrobium sp.]|nr:alpha-glucuronidase family glycosyl hydrolase [Sphingomicrobium sp.]
MLSTTPLRLLLFMLLAITPAAAVAEDGYDLWLRYRPVEAEWRAAYAARAASIVDESRSPTSRAAVDDLRRGVTGLLERTPGTQLIDGAIILRTSAAAPLKGAGDEGYCLKSSRV